MTGQAEVFRVMAQEHAEPARSVAANAAAGDHAGKADRHAAALLPGQQPGRYRSAFSRDRETVQLSRRGATASRRN